MLSSGESAIDPAPQSFFEHLPNDNCLIALLVPRAVEKRQRTAPGQCAQLIEQCQLWFRPQLLPVTAAEYVPSVRTMTEPVPQLVRPAERTEPHVQPQ